MIERQPTTVELERLIVRGDASSMELLFDISETRIARIAAFRTTAEFRKSVSISELLSATRVHVLRRQTEFATSATWSPFVWLRDLLLQRIAHTQKSVLPFSALPTASDILQRSGLSQAGVSPLNALDCEILFLVHFEELTFEEIGIVTGISRQGLVGRYLAVLNQIHDAYPASTADDEDNAVNPLWNLLSGLAARRRKGAIVDVSC